MAGVTTQQRLVITIMKENVESVPLEATVTQKQPEVALCVRMEKPLTKKEAPTAHSVDRVKNHVF